MLTGEAHPAQQAYAQRIIGIIYPFLWNKPNLLFFANSIDYLNVCRELKSVFAGSKIVYVHHSFSWKYFLNIPDETFGMEWKKKNEQIHPQAFEMTRYQQEMATISDAVVVVTNHAKDFFHKILDIAEEKITVIYNGIETPGQYSNSKKLLRKKYRISSTDKIILFCGRITRDKGFPDLLKAFKLVADKDEKVRLVVIGAGHIFEYIHFVKPHWNKITFVGEVEKIVISDFYQMADLGVMPSLHEQCSFTAIEMRLHKLPIIVSATDGLDELFSNGQDCLKLSIHLNDKGKKIINEEEFSELIETLLSNKKIKNKIVKTSYQKAHTLFSAERMAFNYQNLFSTLF